MTSSLIELYSTRFIRFESIKDIVSGQNLVKILTSKDIATESQNIHLKVLILN